VSCGFVFAPSDRGVTPCRVHSRGATGLRAFSAADCGKEETNTNKTASVCLVALRKCVFGGSAHVCVWWLCASVCLVALRKCVFGGSAQEGDGSRTERRRVSAVSRFFSWHDVSFPLCRRLDGGWIRALLGNRSDERRRVTTTNAEYGTGTCNDERVRVVYAKQRNFRLVYFGSPNRPREPRTTLHTTRDSDRETGLASHGPPYIPPALLLLYGTGRGGGVGGKLPWEHRASPPSDWQRNDEKCGATGAPGFPVCPSGRCAARFAEPLRTAPALRPGRQLTYCGGIGTRRGCGTHACPRAPGRPRGTVAHPAPPAADPLSRGSAACRRQGGSARVSASAARQSSI